MKKPYFLMSVWSDYIYRNNLIRLYMKHMIPSNHKDENVFMKHYAIDCNART